MPLTARAAGGGRGATVGRGPGRERRSGGVGGARRGYAGLLGHPGGVDAVGRGALERAYERDSRAVLSWNAG